MDRSLPLNGSVLYDHENCQNPPKATRVKPGQKISERLDANSSHSSQLPLKTEGADSVFHMHCEVSLLAYLCQKGTRN